MFFVKLFFTEPLCQWYWVPKCICVYCGGVRDFLSNMFLKSGRPGTCSCSGMQPDAPSSVAPAPSWEDKRWLWPGSWPATWAQHCAQSQIPSPEGPKRSKIWDPSLLLAMQSLPSELSSWTGRLNRWIPHLAPSHCANTGKFTELLCTPFCLTPEVWGYLDSPAQHAVGNVGTRGCVYAVLFLLYEP